MTYRDVGEEDGDKIIGYCILFVEKKKKPKKLNFFRKYKYQLNQIATKLGPYSRCYITRVGTGYPSTSVIESRFGKITL